MHNECVTNAHHHVDAIIVMDNEKTETRYLKACLGKEFEKKNHGELIFLRD